MSLKLLPSALGLGVTAWVCVCGGCVCGGYELGSDLCVGWAAASAPLGGSLLCCSSRRPPAGPCVTVPPLDSSAEPLEG